MSSAFEYSKEHLHSNRVFTIKFCKAKTLKEININNKMKFDIHVVFAGGREIKTFTMVFRDLGEYMLGKWYFQH